MTLRERLAAVFYPNRCACCDAVVRADAEPLCDECAALLVRPADKGACPVCGLAERDCVCGDRLYYDKYAFLFYNEDAASKTVYKLKFSGRQDVAKRYARLLAKALKRRGMLDADAITYIPMAKRRQRERGYNQAELIARELSRETGIPCEETLYKFYDGARQHDLGKTERTGNVLGAFEPVPERAGGIDGKTFIVVDDIKTGGSTAGEAAKTLKIFGAEKVYVATAVAGRLASRRPK